MARTKARIKAKRVPDSELDVVAAAARRERRNARAKANDNAALDLHAAGTFVRVTFEYDVTAVTKIAESFGMSVGGEIPFQCRWAKGQMILPRKSASEFVGKVLSDMNARMVRVDNDAYLQ